MSDKDKVSVDVELSKERAFELICLISKWLSANPNCESIRLHFDGAYESTYKGPKNSLPE